MGKLTEAQMSELFERLVQKGQSNAVLPKFTLYSKEVRCLEGQPDFVASTTYPSCQPPAHYALLGVPSIAAVYALLQPRAPRTEQYLCAHTGLSRQVVHQSLSMLAENRLICEARPKVYTRLESALLSNLELWAFELKVDHWQRALYQAHRDRAFAHNTAVVISQQGFQRAAQHLGRFTAHGVGLLLLDVEKGTLQTIVAPNPRKPSSSWYHIHAIGKFMGENPTPVAD